MSSRRSVRRFTAELPPRELIERIIASAVTAPSASNKQPWRFSSCTSRVTIDALATAVQAAVDRIALAIEPEFEAAFRAYGDYFTRFEAAPLVIVPLFRAITMLSNLTGARLGEDDRVRIAAMERDSGLIGTSLALQNLLLAAHAAGLGASAMTGPLVAVDELRRCLRVPPSWHIAALVPIGYADETPRPAGTKAWKAGDRVAGVSLPMSRAEIAARLRPLLADSLAVPADAITLQSRLIDDLGADSLDFVDLDFRDREDLRRAHPRSRLRLPDATGLQLARGHARRIPHGRDARARLAVSARTGERAGSGARDAGPALLAADRRVAVHHD